MGFQLEIKQRTGDTHMACSCLKASAISSWNTFSGVNLWNLCRNFSLLKFPEPANKSCKQPEVIAPLSSPPLLKKLSGGLSKAYLKRKQPVPTYGKASQRFPCNILGDQPRRHAAVFISQKACVCPEHLEPWHPGQIPPAWAAWEAVLCITDRAVAFPQDSPHIKTLCPSPSAQSWIFR